jgi:hypothetical protein
MEKSESFFQIFSRTQIEKHCSRGSEYKYLKRENISSSVLTYLSHISKELVIKEFDCIHLLDKFKDKTLITAACIL